MHAASRRTPATVSCSTDASGSSRVGSCSVVRIPSGCIYAAIVCGVLRLAPLAQDDRSENKTSVRGLDNLFVRERMGALAQGKLSTAGKDEWRLSRSGRHATTNELRGDFAPLYNFPTQAKNGLERATPSCPIWAAREERRL
jgi:hypothetical protein